MTNKFRSDPSIDGSFDFTGYFPNGTISSPTRKYNYTVPGRLQESFSYEDGPKRLPNGMPNDKNCSHSKIITECPPVSCSELYHDGSYTRISGLRDFRGNFVEVEPDLPSNFVARAFNAMKPDLESGFSALNFFAELKDLKSFIPRADGIVSRMMNTKAVSEAHLNYSFGIAPLINDIASFIEAWNLFDLRLYNLYKRAGKVQTAYFKEIAPVKSVTHVTPPGPYGNGLRSTSQLLSYQRTAVMRYTYSVPRISLPKLKLKYFGFRGDPRIIWNALPFSFVVDWFIGINDFLAQFDEGAVQPSVSVLSFTVSTSEKYLHEARYIDGRGSIASFSSGNALLTKVRTEKYQRSRLPYMVGIPDLLPSLPIIDSFDGREQLLAISLGNVLRR